MKYAVSLSILAILAGPAVADEVKLRTGGSIVGIAREEGDRVVVELPIGTIAVPRSDVIEIIPGRTLLHAYEEKFAEIQDRRDPEAFYRLAQWAKTNGISRHVEPLLQHVLSLDPDHEGAREDLGFVRDDGRWLTRSEYLKEQGYVEFRGTWMEAEDRDALLRAEDERRDLRKRKTTKDRSYQPTVPPLREEPSSYRLGLPPYRDDDRSYSRSGEVDSWFIYPWIWNQPGV
ncbi:MAG: hypothetical protein HY716_13010 [Planctomycetes bacterium]|nr:hypothetical protein [Planctomycetota bacterium]